MKQVDAADIDALNNHFINDVLMLTGVKRRTLYRWKSNSEHTHTIKLNKYHLYVKRDAGLDWACVQGHHCRLGSRPINQYLRLRAVIIETESNKKISSKYLLFLGYEYCTQFFDFRLIDASNYLKDQELHIPSTEVIEFCKDFSSKLHLPISRIGLTNDFTNFSDFEKGIINTFISSESNLLLDNIEDNLDREITKYKLPPDINSYEKIFHIIDNIRIRHYKKESKHLLEKGLKNYYALRKRPKNALSNQPIEKIISENTIFNP